MRAKPGDWLVIEQPNIDHEARRGRIEEVRSADGGPPYRVRWLDTDRVALVFPGPDAHVLTRAEHDVAEARANARLSAIRREISEGVPQCAHETS